MHHQGRLILMLCSYLFLLVPAISYAQKSQLGNWFQYIGNNPINKKWNWWNEFQYRNYNFAGDHEQFLLRTGIGYNITENNNNVLLGYAFIHSQNYVSDTLPKVKTNEHRIFQQYIYRHSISRVFIQHRYRVEERFIGSVFKMRFRYMLGITIPLNKKTMEKYALYLSGYNELFINTVSPIFDRDRAYGGVGFVISKYLRLETGVMYQLFEKRKRPQWQIMFFNTIPFKKS